MALFSEFRRRELYFEREFPNFTFIELIISEILRYSTFLTDEHIIKPD
jgi:hypothetical protein